MAFKAAPWAILPWVGIFAALLLSPARTLHAAGSAFLWFNLFLLLLLGCTVPRTSTLPI